jgi:hypothetical protein
MNDKISEQQTVVLKNIPVVLNEDEVIKQLNLQINSERIRSIVRELIDITIKHAVPKAIYKRSVASNEGRNICVDGVKLTSWVPTLTFRPQEIVYPYVATCGLEIDLVQIPKTDFMKHYVMNQIKQSLLFLTSEYLQDHLIQTYELEQLTHIGPGEALGPTSQQKQLFDIIGDVEKEIGVRLTTHNLMIPEKSTSGILFETTIRLERCQLCPDAKCEARRATYEPKILLKYRH